MFMFMCMCMCMGMVGSVGMFVVVGKDLLVGEGPSGGRGGRDAPVPVPVPVQVPIDGGWLNTTCGFFG